MKTDATFIVSGIGLILTSQAFAANPLPPVTKSGLTVELVDFVDLPDATPSQYRDGINYLTESPDGTGRLFAMDSRGGAYIIENGVNVGLFFNLSTAPSVVGQPDIDILIGNFGQQGLGGIAFHPDYANNGAPGFGKFYTAHSDNISGKPAPDFPSPGSTTHHSVITEWQVDPLDPYALDTSSRRELLRIGQPFTDHNMQQLAFNPLAGPGDADYGNLYVAMGDGGNNWPPVPTDPFQNGQNAGSPLGSILRIDPLGNNSANGNYGIPLDNPFVGDPDLQHTLAIDESTTPGDETADEIWAYGLRNPHRFSWDTGLNGTANMYISDIGQASIEEINLGSAGANYGWRDREGTWSTDPNNQNTLNALPGNDALYGYTYPVAQYDHDEGFAIVGGFVYRGQAISTLQGKYIFGDLVNGRLFYTDVDDMGPGNQTPGNQADIHELTIMHDGSEQSLLDIIGTPGSPAPRADLRFGVDSNGEIYVISKRTGEIFSLLPQEIAPGDLSPGDGIVGLNDLDVVLNHWNQQVAARDPSKGDPTGDGFVGLDDLDFVLNHWNNTATPPTNSANIPEPTGMITLGLIGVLCRRKTSRTP